MKKELIFNKRGKLLFIYKIIIKIFKDLVKKN